MSGLQVSGATRALLEAARQDGPAAVSRAKIWSGVAATAGIGVAVGTTSMAVGAGASASKLVAIGALLGSAVTVGVTLALLRVTSPHPAAPRPVVVASVPPVTAFTSGAANTVPSPAKANASGERDPLLAVPSLARPVSGSASVSAQDQGWADSPLSPGRSPVASFASPMAPVGSDAPAVQGSGSIGAETTHAVGAGPARTGSGSRGVAAAAGRPASSALLSSAPLAVPVEERHALVAVHTSSGDPVAARDAHGAAKAARHGAAGTHPDAPPTTIDDPLMREAALVAEARGSLVRGDALGALRTIRATASVSHRELEPEELSIESHALRALGRDAEAAQVDVALRARYPDHALSR